MSNPKLTAFAAIGILAASIAYSFTIQGAPKVDSVVENPFHGKVLVLDGPKWGYGVQENVEVRTVGTTTFLELQPFKRTAEKDGASYDEQHWIPLDKLSTILVFTSRDAAEDYERRMSTPPPEPTEVLEK
ncbi:MAG: hypothetical protein H6821_02265 [Planctomycetaceae bacterium]|nr:hypothetical protein [Planctomycetales bacterium]MCA9171699.1 hypothetical protein [Planctomycetales bacterium]MCB9872978.1 hypothetical protein [Planctomycetaceae bacterium]MCB9937567.1 hypothetical protein [Planctomycetaceae bacterium]